MQKCFRPNSLLSSLATMFTIWPSIKLWVLSFNLNFPLSLIINKNINHWKIGLFTFNTVWYISDTDRSLVLIRCPPPGCILRTFGFFLFKKLHLFKAIPLFYLSSIPSIYSLLLFSAPLNFYAFSLIKDED